MIPRGIGLALAKEDMKQSNIRELELINELHKKDKRINFLRNALKMFLDVHLNEFKSPNGLSPSMIFEWEEIFERDCRLKLNTDVGEIHIAIQEDVKFIKGRR